MLTRSLSSYERAQRIIPALTGRGYNPWREPGDLDRKRTVTTH